LLTLTVTVTLTVTLTMTVTVTLTVTLTLTMTVTLTVTLTLTMALTVTLTVTMTMTVTMTVMVHYAISSHRSLLLDGVIHFTSVNWNMLGSVKPYAAFPMLHLDNKNLNLVLPVTDHHAFILLT